MSNSIAIQSSNLVFCFYGYIDLSIEGDQWRDQFSHKNSRLEIINIYSWAFEPVWKLGRKGSKVELVFSQYSCVLNVRADKRIISTNVGIQRSNFVWMTIGKIFKTAILTQDFLKKKNICCYQLPSLCLDHRKSIQQYKQYQKVPPLHFPSLHGLQPGVISHSHSKTRVIVQTVGYNSDGTIRASKIKHKWEGTKIEHCNSVAQQTSSQL